MNITVDLKNLKTDEEIFHKFGEIFEFGGPDPNQTLNLIDHSGWGQNWDAFNDCLTLLPDGGIWGNSKITGFHWTYK